MQLRNLLSGVERSEDEAYLRRRVYYAESASFPMYSAFLGRDAGEATVFRHIGAAVPPRSPFPRLLTAPVCHRALKAPATGTPQP